VEFREHRLQGLHQENHHGDKLGVILKLMLDVIRADRPTLSAIDRSSRYGLGRLVFGTSPSSWLTHGLLSENKDYFLAPMIVNHLTSGLGAFKGPLGRRLSLATDFLLFYYSVNY
jgi:hypothetical protein